MEGFVVFPSRSRHTTGLSDLSSDVCSSALLALALTLGAAAPVAAPLDHACSDPPRQRARLHQASTPGRGPRVLSERGVRSEERRVGEECRPWGWPAYYAKADARSADHGARG